MAKGVKMKESFIFGIMAGAVVGMLVYKYSKDAQNLVDKGEMMIKEEMENCKKKMSKAPKKVKSAVKSAIKK